MVLLHSFAYYLFGIILSLGQSPTTKVANPLFLRQNSFHQVPFSALNHPYFYIPHTLYAYPQLEQVLRPNNFCSRKSLLRVKFSTQWMGYSCSYFNSCSFVRGNPSNMTPLYDWGSATFLFIMSRTISSLTNPPSFTVFLIALISSESTV